MAVSIDVFDPEEAECAFAYPRRHENYDEASH